MARQTTVKENTVYSTLPIPQLQSQASFEFMKSTAAFMNSVVSELEQHKASLDKAVKSATLQSKEMRHLKSETGSVATEVSSLKEDVAHLKEVVSVNTLQKHPVKNKKLQAWKFAYDEMMKEYAPIDERARSSNDFKRHYNYVERIANISKDVKSYTLFKVKALAVDFNNEAVSGDAFLTKQFCQKYYDHYYQKKVY
jgi:hypothetical protein